MPNFNKKIQLMQRSFLSMILVFAGIAVCNAQTDETNNKTCDNFIGVQVNGLIKQILNANTAATGNPYLFNYSIDSKKTNYGFRIGIGYNDNVAANTTGINVTSSKTNDLQLRLGFEKAYILSHRWSAGIGIDFILNYNNDYNNNANNYYSDTTISNSKTLMTTYGAGAMGWLHYNITKHIVLGTESSYYYYAGTKNQTVDYTTNIAGSNVVAESKINTTVSHGNFSSPMVIYLMIKL